MSACTRVGILKQVCVCVVVATFNDWLLKGHGQKTFKCVAVFVVVASARPEKYITEGEKNLMN